MSAKEKCRKPNSVFKKWEEKTQHFTPTPSKSSSFHVCHSLHCPTSGHQARNLDLPFSSVETAYFMENRQQLVIGSRWWNNPWTPPGEVVVITQWHPRRSLQLWAIGDSHQKDLSYSSHPTKHRELCGCPGLFLADVESMLEEGLQIPHCYRSIAKLYLTLFNPVDCRPPGSSILHYLPEFAQIHFYWVSPSWVALHALDYNFELHKPLYHDKAMWSMIALCVLVTQSCTTLCHPMDCSPPGSSVHGIFQSRILEWVAIPFSRGSSLLRARIWISRIAGGFTVWATRDDTFAHRN